LILSDATLLDSVSILFGHAEMMANLHKQLGADMSRRRHYAWPGPATLEYARDFAGLWPINESSFFRVGDVRYTSWVDADQLR
jgi:hypothetical protein